MRSQREAISRDEPKDVNNIAPRDDTRYVEDGTQHSHPVSAKYLGTLVDQQEMSFLGREQVLRRNFGFVPVLGFGCALIGTWEFILSLVAFGLTDGGTAGLIYGFVICVFGFSMVYLSLSEMASMAPTSAGQYHWVSEFAPESSQKYLSYITGYLVATGWQCSIASTAFLAGTIIQGLLVLNVESYKYQRWHGTMLVIAIAVFSVIFNTFFSKKLPLVESIILVVYIVGLFAIIIPLWVMGPRANAQDVFTEFNNSGGWSSTGTAVMIGLSGTIASMAGFDCVVHMSEEIENASQTVPKAIMVGNTVNSILGFLMVVTLCFTLGDVNSVLSTPTGYPFIQIFFNTTHNYAVTNFMTSIIVVVFTCSVISEIATSSRQLWSFARDGGLPLSSIIKKVYPGWNIPLNAVLVSLVITILLSLINIGSTVTLYAITSLVTSSFMSSYIITISCVLLKRLRGHPLPARRWTLGRYGMIVNIASLCFLLPLFIFAFFPLATPVVPTTMNWSCLMFGGIIILATLYYGIYGHKQYVPPVRLVKREQYDL